MPVRTLHRSCSDEFALMLFGPLIAAWTFVSSYAMRLQDAQQWLQPTTTTTTTITTTPLQWVSNRPEEVQEQKSTLSFVHPNVKNRCRPTFCCTLIEDYSHYAVQLCGCVRTVCVNHICLTMQVQPHNASQCSLTMQVESAKG